MNFMNWFRKNAPEPQPDLFEKDFDKWLKNKVFTGYEEVYVVAIKGSNALCMINGTFEFHTEPKTAQKRRKDLQPDNPSTRLEVRKISFKYKNL